MIEVEAAASPPLEPIGVAPRAETRSERVVAIAAEEVTAHALAWLVAGSAVGLWMALLLLFPRLGTALGPWTYGRWAPLHLDLTLYGWLSIPLVGLLVRAYSAERFESGVRWTLAVWSSALVVGAASWLGGETSGKLFLDWSGPAAWLFAGAQGCAAALLAAGLAARVRERGWRAGEVARAAFWLLLVGVPAALLLASGGSLYPPIDPASGGPTGVSLLGSSLGLFAVLLATPRALGLREIAGRGAWVAPVALVLHLGLFLALDHGDHGHREPVQQLALASVAIWAWLLPREAGRFLWPVGSRRWLRALAGWGVLLLASGLGAFLPGALERVKFGQGLVAHAHVAMAGFASCFVALLLHVLLAGGARAELWTRTPPFALWQAGLALQVVALASLGAAEASDPAAMLRGGAAIEGLLALRAVGGAAMLAAALLWGRAAFRRRA